MKDIKQLLGKRIKELRTKQGFSQQELAELIGIDQRSLSYIECGGSFPSKSLLELATALKVELNELFDFEHHKLDTTEMTEYIATNLKDLQPDEIKTIYRLIKAMR